MPACRCPRPMHRAKPGQVLEKIARNLGWRAAACDRVARDSSHCRLRRVIYYYSAPLSIAPITRRNYISWKIYFIANISPANYDEFLHYGYLHCERKARIIDSRFRGVKWIGRVSNILGAVEHSKSEAGEEVPRWEITRDRTKLKSRRAYGYRFSLGASLSFTRDNRTTSHAATLLLTLQKNVYVL